jgi:hypothetical protein
MCDGSRDTQIWGLQRGRVRAWHTVHGVGIVNAAAGRRMLTERDFLWRRHELLLGQLCFPASERRGHRFNDLRAVGVGLRR